MKTECNDTQNMSTTRLTFRDLLDRIMAGVNSGEIIMSDPVPEGFLQDGHIGVAEYIADKYDIRGDADGHNKGTAEYIPK